jgi:hypothetical protein
MFKAGKERISPPLLLQREHIDVPIATLFT